MAPRQSATQTAARQRARALAAAYQERETTLLNLAGEYFVAADTLEAIDERAERDIQKIRDRADADGAAARAEATAVMVKMLAAGATRHEVAERLGISTRDVPRPDKTTHDTDSDTSTGAGAAADAVDDARAALDATSATADDSDPAAEPAGEHEATTASERSDGDADGGSRALPSEPGAGAGDHADADPYAPAGTDMHAGAGGQYVPPSWSHQP